jgi:hypothetical protein
MRGLLFQPLSHPATLRQAKNAAAKPSTIW